MTQYIAINNEQDQTFKLEHPSGSGALTVTSKEIYDAIHPRTLTETAIFTGIDNKIVMPGIVSALGLEVGDVIRIDTGAYNKLHTVESTTDNSSIIVNYEHAGNRGDGSLKLPDFTGQATVTRVAKWFNAPIGLGQAWQLVTDNRAINTVYTNTSGRTIVAAVGVALTNTSTATDLQVKAPDSSTWVYASRTTGPGDGGYIYDLRAEVPAGHEYRVTGGSPSLNTWRELH